VASDRLQRRAAAIGLEISPSLSVETRARIVDRAEVLRAANARHRAWISDFLEAQRRPS